MTDNRLQQLQLYADDTFVFFSFYRFMNWLLACMLGYPNNCVTFVGLTRYQREEHLESLERFRNHIMYYLFRYLAQFVHCTHAHMDNAVLVGLYSPQSHTFRAAYSFRNNLCACTFTSMKQAWYEHMRG